MGKALKTTGIVLAAGVALALVGFIGGFIISPLRGVNWLCVVIGVFGSLGVIFAMFESSEDWEPLVALSALAVFWASLYFGQACFHSLFPQYWAWELTRTLK